ncbi:MAG: cytochrome c-type biogenesis protein CcmH [Pseudomonadales bacterium]|nr:cytochrome c-type biogenesis protein CcmH [Pseudomonadales bacterium]NIX08451.1 cytochrome c-type biogenesis protein CcmH [Pseudomonadales bacterium]
MRAADLRPVAMFGLLLAASAAFGAGPVDVYDFPDPATEARYRALIAEFRCPKCLNTNLAGSDAPIAKDLRRTVHRLVVVEEKSDAEVREFLQSRYGDFVLYDPPFRFDTSVLWLAPGILLLVGLAVLYRVLRQPPAATLSQADAKRLREILEEP